MLQQIEAPSAEAGNGPVLLDVELRPLTVELGLGDPRAVREPCWISKALAEHWGDEVSHSLALG